MGDNQPVNVGLAIRVVIHGGRTREIRDEKNQISDFFVRGQLIHGHADKQKSDI